MVEAEKREGWRALAFWKGYKWCLALAFSLSTLATGLLRGASPPTSGNEPMRISWALAVEITGFVACFSILGWFAGREIARNAAGCFAGKGLCRYAGRLALVAVLGVFFAMRALEVGRMSSELAAGVTRAEGIVQMLGWLVVAATLGGVAGAESRACQNRKALSSPGSPRPEAGQGKGARGRLARRGGSSSTPAARPRN